MKTNSKNKNTNILRGYYLSTFGLQEKSDTYTYKFIKVIIFSLAKLDDYRDSQPNYALKKTIRSFFFFLKKKKPLCNLNLRFVKDNLNHRHFLQKNLSSDNICYKKDMETRVILTVHLSLGQSIKTVSQKFNQGKKV